MPKLSEEFKSEIKVLSREDLEKIVIRFAQKYAEMHDYILINHIDKSKGEREVFSDAQSDLDVLMSKSYKGFSFQLQMANKITACVKRINEFDKVCKSKHLVADLCIYVLDSIFSLPENTFGSCFTNFDYKASLLTQKLITLVQKKLHPDYMANYRNNINTYLSILHSRASFHDFVYKMPKEV